MLVYSFGVKANVAVEEAVVVVEELHIVGNSNNK
jgi:hypothetical protein